MPGNNVHKVDDGDSSVASFEEINVMKAGSHDKMSAIFKDLIAHGRKLGSSSKEKENIAGDEAEEEDVPDVLYVVQYRDVGGRVVDTRQSNKPLDLALDANEEAGNKKKPVIEILTKVSASLNRNRTNRRRPRYGGYSPAYTDSEASSDEEDEKMKITKIETTEMVIHSKHLINALNAVVGYYPGANFLTDTVTIDAPYYVLIHHREALARYKTAQPASHDSDYVTATAKHIDVLLDFLEKTYGERIRDEEDRHRNKPPAATFDWLWLILKPGEIIYAKAQNSWVPFLISFVDNITSSQGKLMSYTVECWNLRFSMGKLRRTMSSFSVHSFPGEQAIHSLHIVPAAFFPDNILPGVDVTMTETQIQLGKVYWDLSKRPAYKDYDGQLVEKDSCMNGTVTGRVIVDADGYERFINMGPDAQRRRAPPPPGRGGPPPPVKDQLPRFGPRCSCKPCSKQGDREETGPFADFEDLDPNHDKQPKNDIYFLLLSPDIPAFILSERRWAHVSIERLKDVKSDREAFKYLVLDDEIKLTVKALIGKFASADGKVSPWPNDFVKNKGEGRIFLLHGSPGVGKTCTAECVAELTHRPLLSLTSGDISTSMSSSSVERNLHYFLQLGERYGALVLLDEADVYLEERRTKDLHRNGLVSIFLRALEYYRGVLFLTTNRVEAFDSAFTSRIHVALHYKRLTDEDRLRIWQNNFDRLERDSLGKAYVSLNARDFAYESDDVRALRWNGREIRNALQTAVALAETEAMEDGLEKVNVTEKHLKAVVKMSKGFKDFLRRRRGYDEEYEDSDDEEDEDGNSVASDDL